MPEQRSGFFQNQGGDIPQRWIEVVACIQCALGSEGNCLVRGKRAHGKETRRVSSEAVERDHANPGFDWIKVFAEECFAQQANAAKGLWMVKCQEFCWSLNPPAPIKARQPDCNVSEWRWGETRGDKHLAERIRIPAGSPPSAKCGFEQGGAASHERIQHGVAGTGESIDEIGCESRFEAGAIGDLMEWVRVALPIAPK